MTWEAPELKMYFVETVQQNLYFGLKVLPLSGRFCPGIGKTSNGRLDDNQCFLVFKALFFLESYVMRI